MREINEDGEEVFINNLTISRFLGCLGCFGYILAAIVALAVVIFVIFVGISMLQNGGWG